MVSGGHVGRLAKCVAMTRWDKHLKPFGVNGWLARCGHFHAV